MAHFKGCMFFRISFYLAGCFILSSAALNSEPLVFALKGEAGILMNAESGAILFEHQAFIPRYPASVTKVATALYALKSLGDAFDPQLQIEAKRDSLVSFSQEAKKKNHYKHPAWWLEPDGMHIGIKSGEILSLQSLLEGMLIASGNDAANVICQALGPSIPVFMEGLNQYLKEIGCEKTFFCNPHGLHDPKHESTPYDLALIAREALKYPTFRQIVSQDRFIRPKTNKQTASTFLQTNRLLRTGKYFYRRAIGIKTGWHSAAKNNLIAAAQENDRMLIVVLMGYKDRGELFEDAIRLFDIAFNQPRVQRHFLKAGLQPFVLDLPGGQELLKTHLTDPLTLEYYPAEEPNAKCLLQWDSLALPIEKDQQVGQLQLVVPSGKILKTAPLLAVERVEPKASKTWIYLIAAIGFGAVLAVLAPLIAKRFRN